MRNHSNDDSSVKAVRAGIRLRRVLIAEFVIAPAAKARAKAGGLYAVARWLRSLGSKAGSHG